MKYSARQFGAAIGIVALAAITVQGTAWGGGDDTIECRTWHPQISGPTIDDWHPTDVGLEQQDTWNPVYPDLRQPADDWNPSSPDLRQPADNWNPTDRRLAVPDDVWHPVGAAPCDR